jgi:hypothetical protein
MTTRYHGKVIIDDVEYGWNFRHRSRLIHGEQSGPSLYVFIVDGPGRDLVLQFPFQELTTFERTVDHSMIVAALRECIPLALAAGWDPSKRGKTKHFLVAELRRLPQS